MATGHFSDHKEVIIMDHNNVPEQFGLSSTIELNMVNAPAKAGMKSLGTSNEMFMVKPGILRVKEMFNPRIKDERYWQGVEKLALSIEKNGFYKDKPLAVQVVKEGADFVGYVMEGGRRLDAVMLRLSWMPSEEATKFVVPCVAKDRETNEVDLVYGLAQGNSAEPFRPYEMAVLVKRLKQVYGQTEEQILEKMGGMVSATHLTNLLIVAGAPRKIAELVIAEKLSVTQAAKIMNQHGNDAVAVLEKAESNAKAEGKEKITDRYMPGAKLQKAVKKEAPALYQSAIAVMNDPGFESLSEETRAVLRDLMNELRANEDPIDSAPVNDESVAGEDSSAA